MHAAQKIDLTEGREPITILHMVSNYNGNR